MANIEEKAKTAGTADSPKAPSAPAFQAPKKKRKWLKRVILLAAVLVALFLVLRACGKNGKKSSSEMFFCFNKFKINSLNLFLSAPASGVFPAKTFKSSPLMSL